MLRNRRVDIEICHYYIRSDVATPIAATLSVPTPISLSIERELNPTSVKLIKKMSKTEYREFKANPKIEYRRWAQPPPPPGDAKRRYPWAFF
jgi:hypothetical protein